VVDEATALGASLRTCACGSGCYRHARRMLAAPLFSKAPLARHLWELAPLSVTARGGIPARTLVGFSESEERVGGGGGTGVTGQRGSSRSATVNRGDVTVVDEPTVVVFTGMSRWCSAGTVTARRCAGCPVVTRKPTCRRHRWELSAERPVPVEEFPPATLVGSAEARREWAGRRRRLTGERGSSGNATVTAEMVTVSTKQRHWW